MTDTIMLEAPARGWRISDLADGQGRILRLHDLTASWHASPWIYGPDTSDIHPRPSAKEGRTNMKMRTDVLWEPDKTDEHDRLLSRFEDDIIGLRARTDSPCEMAIHP